MYFPILILHSLLRWVVLAAGLWAVVRALGGLIFRRPWTPTDAQSGRWFSISLDLQVLLGLLLYAFLSPIASHAFADMGAAMRDPILRFWAVEHVTMMLAALVLAHIGSARARRASTSAAKHRTSLIFYALALLAVLAAIPWPFMADARPLFRLF